MTITALGEGRIRSLRTSFVSDKERVPVDRLEKAHAEKCTAVRGDCTALHPDSEARYEGCLIWHGCFR